jgi:hypothetical protein
MLLQHFAILVMLIGLQSGMVVETAIQDGSYVQVVQNGQKYVGHIHLEDNKRTLNICGGGTLALNDADQPTPLVGMCPLPNNSPGIITNNVPTAAPGAPM